MKKDQVSSGKPLAGVRPQVKRPPRNGVQCHGLNKGNKIKEIKVLQRGTRCCFLVRWDATSLAAHWDTALVWQSLSKMFFLFVCYSDTPKMELISLNTVLFFLGLSDYLVTHLSVSCHRKTVARATTSQCATRKQRRLPLFRGLFYLIPFFLWPCYLISDTGCIFFF